MLIYGALRRFYKYSLKSNFTSKKCCVKNSTNVKNTYKIPFELKLDLIQQESFYSDLISKATSSGSFFWVTTSIKLKTYPTLIFYWYIVIRLARVCQRESQFEFHFTSLRCSRHAVNPPGRMFSSILEHVSPSIDVKHSIELSQKRRHFNKLS